MNEQTVLSTCESNPKVNQTLKLPATELITIFIFKSYVEQELDEKNNSPILQSHTLCSFLVLFYRWSLP